MNKLPETMRGAMLLGPEAIEVRDVPTPRPSEGEALVRIGAANTCGTNVKVFRRGGHPRMLKVPTLFGHEMTGTVAAVGMTTSSLAVGERVVVSNSAPCGRCEYCENGRENLCTDLHYLNGAFAEYLLIPERFVRVATHRLPDDLPFERAALTEPLACVLHGIDACEARALGSDEVIVYGAGPIGLLFVGTLARAGHSVILADPNPQRLEVGEAFGATKAVVIERGGGQSEVVRAQTRGGRGAAVAVDATGVPEVWADAMESVRPGGTVNLFGGCAPGTTMPIDTHRIHYSEITIKGVYHHRPATVCRAIELLTDPAFKADLLLSGTRPIEETEEALRSMMRKETLKVVIRSERGIKY